MFRIFLMLRQQKHLKINYFFTQVENKPSLKLCG